MGWITRSMVAVGAMLVPAVVFACPFCNVDGPIIRWFVLFVVGPYLLGAVMMLFWSVSAGHYEDTEDPKFRMLILDDETGVRSDTLTQGDR